MNQQAWRNKRGTDKKYDEQEEDEAKANAHANEYKYILYYFKAKYQYFIYSHIFGDDCVGVLTLWINYCFTEFLFIYFIYLSLEVEDFFSIYLGVGHKWNDDFKYIYIFKQVVWMLGIN